MLFMLRNLSQPEPVVSELSRHSLSSPSVTVTGDLRVGYTEGGPGSVCRTL